jgi:hypothetical protein
MQPAAMICAELWNTAGPGREKLSEGLVPKDFLRNSAEERARREAEEEEARKAPVNPEQFASFEGALGGADEEEVLRLLLRRWRRSEKARGGLDRRFATFWHSGSPCAQDRPSASASSNALFMRPREFSRPSFYQPTHS